MYRYLTLAFERPAWQRLMDDIRAGRVDCICVKDLSRFSRNYIETIEFIEKIFPFMGIRFISINDGFDSEISKGNSENLIVALKSIVNDQYLRDVSRKMVSAHSQRRERGEFTGPYAPLGYLKSTTEKGKLVIDPETAPIIRQIFEWRAEGIGHITICKRLDAMDIPTPLGWRRIKFGVYTEGNYKATVWQTKAIQQIVRGRVYLGCLELGKRRAALYEHKRKKFVPEAEWHIVENAHEPLVSQELWDAANAVESSRRKKYFEEREYRTYPENIFKGYLSCGVCGSMLVPSFQTHDKASGTKSGRYIYNCPLKRQHENSQQFKQVPLGIIYDTVYSLVADELKLASNLSEIISKRAKRGGNPRAALDAEINSAQRELETINQRLAGLYENYVDKLLNEAEYVGLKAEYEDRAESIRLRIEALSKRATVVSDVADSDNRWIKAARDFQDPKELTREMLEAIVERIDVLDGEHIKVIWKFGDEFALLKLCASDEVLPTDGAFINEKEGA